jgi:2-polyprenyl-3-methyl-5-hydroxy-6-metoxy-1,4-benzoquinol methylase
MASVGFIRALIVLHRAYGQFPLRMRAHVLLRFLTSPFLRIVSHVPPGTRVLEIGAGHGLFARLAAEQAAWVVALDPDARKVRRVDRVSSVIGYDPCVRGSFDVVAIIDVLYKIPIADWDPLLDRIRQRVAPGGLLIIKEHDPTARLKHAWNRLQERLASAMDLTLGESFSYETPDAFRSRMLRHGFERVEILRIDRGYPHPHVLYVARAISSAVLSS